MPVSILGMQPHATLLIYWLNCVEASLGLAIMWCNHPCRDKATIPTSPVNWEANPLEYDCIFFSNFLANVTQWDCSISSLQQEERFSYFICTSQRYIAATNFWILQRKIKFSFHFTITDGRSLGVSKRYHPQVPYVKEFAWTDILFYQQKHIALSLETINQTLLLLRH